MHLPAAVCSHDSLLFSALVSLEKAVTLTTDIVCCEMLPAVLSQVIVT
jgi:hypothetical protein